MTDQKRHQKREAERIMAIGATMLVTLLLAACAGVILALVDTHSGLGDLVYAMTYSGPPVSEVTQIEAEPPIQTPEPAETVEEEPQEPEQIVSDDTVSENMVSDNSVSDNSVSDNSVSDNQAAVPTYPQPFQLVDESYFDDALFIGDSRMEGFGMHSGLNATFYAATGLQLHEINKYKVVKTANGKVPIFDALQPNLYKKVYIKVGLNELGWGTDELFLQEYTDLIARIREMEPGAIIYIHGLIHVTETKSQNDSIHTNEKINTRNEMLKQFAAEQQAYYVDINEVVSDANGALLPDLTSDGVHLRAQYMELWKNYLMAHAVAY